MAEVPSYEVAIVSCDIVGHSAVRDHRLQADRVAAINAIMAATIAGCQPGAAVWASGGDGGHLVLRGKDWPDQALDLIRRLRSWAEHDAVHLRVTGHVGPVTDLVGADGRTQIVGDGINVAGWLLTRGAAAGVVVTRAFRDGVLADGERAGLTFHDERVLRDKSGEQRCLFLMSTAADPSGWDLPTETDRVLLRAAMKAHDGWTVLQQIKRITQADQGDAEAERCLKQLQMRHLTRDLPDDDDANASYQFLEKLGMDALRDIVRVGHLVERRYNEYICRTGDSGDTMFLILHGQVGVYLPARDAAAQAPARPAFVHQEGETVGELAFALSRTRTADLVALTDTTLLAFSYAQIATRLAERSLDRVLDFMTARALEHVSQHVPFLLGPGEDGPLAAGDGDWESALLTLADYCHLIQVRGERARLSLADVQAESPVAGDGISFLVSGELRTEGPGGAAEVAGRRLTGTEFPLLWVQVPDVAVLPGRSFRIDRRPVKILHIDAQGFFRLEPEVCGALHAAVRLAARDCFEYDAFISYNSGDVEVARRWAEELEADGLRVFRDEPRRGAEFPRRLWLAIRQSRALVPLISPRVILRDQRDNWVRREIDAHKHYFGEESRIYPVILAGATPEQIADGFHPIEIGGDEPASIRELAAELKKLRDGSELPPVAMSVRPESPPRV
ncbi:cyclic nucleotide-binding domain-containing protein [Actinoplanes sp. N902-109]|uniref:cyclic nucleotide-binding domain-containing protein n=1 Tax=Actinoplanes sp. (strain N902-109) TaxID=649831 RepID=UPI0003295DA3|nr:cyclic nucleotide-binding domain-containing protein [Actinoplanes sp. N902-109]AGL21545.1 hypothetical protein L083_8035 [Actinoplanes sp. N902-109]